MNNTPSLGGEPQPQPPPPLNLSGGGCPPPPLNLYVGPPPPLTSLITRRTDNYIAFSNAQKLAEEEGTALNPEFTTSPSLSFDEKGEWNEKRSKLEEEARNAEKEGINYNPNKTIRFVEEKPKIHFYTPQSSEGGGGGGGGGVGGGRQ